MSICRIATGRVTWAALALCAPLIGFGVLPAMAGHRTPRKADNDQEQMPLFEGLGRLNHRVTTHVPLAQRYFDQGLRLVYGFNHDEATRSFEAAAAADPDCAMAPWGIALALGPNYNLEVDEPRQKAAFEAIQTAKMLAAGVNAHERAYIEALALRFSADPAADRKQLDQDYANAMRKLASSYPNDLDAATLFAAAAMDLRPWDLWKPDGSPQPGTDEIVATLERVLATDPNHPGANHLYIHAVEASATPERAAAAADRLAGLMPAAGHLVHMPAHIYYRIGRYRDAALTNIKAIAVDKAYIERRKPQGIYPAMYYPHNVHFLWSALCMEGRSKEALEAAEQFGQMVTADMIREMPMIEGFAPTQLFTLIRFEKWDDVLAAAAPPEDFAYTTGIWHYARGSAFAEQGKFDEAQREKAALDKILAATPDDQKLMRHPVSTLLGVATHLLQGRIALRQQQHDTAIAALREAVRLQDTLEYDEPPGWYYPTRQSLGAALLTADRPGEAETVYREDLDDYPRNGWSLFGLARCLQAQGQTDQAATVEAQFRQAWQGADFELKASQY